MVDNLFNKQLFISSREAKLKKAWHINGEKERKQSILKLENEQKVKKIEWNI